MAKLSTPMREVVVVVSIVIIIDVINFVITVIIIIIIIVVRNLLCEFQPRLFKIYDCLC